MLNISIIKRATVYLVDRDLVLNIEHSSKYSFEVEVFLGTTVGLEYYKK
jgi:hypothetical protein